MVETHARTIARALSYRIVAILLTALIVGVATAIYIHVLLTVLHYAIERFWLKIKWGKLP